MNAVPAVRAEHLGKKYGRRVALTARRVSVGNRRTPLLILAIQELPHG